MDGQEKMIEEARKDGAVIHVERLSGANSPYLIGREAVAGFSRQAIGAELEKLT